MINIHNALVVAAHPDDEVLGVGGTIPKIVRSGGKVTVVVVTDGSSTQYRGDTLVSKSKSSGLTNANALLGTTNVIHWNFPDMKLDTLAHVELNQALENLIAKSSFDTVFVHHHGDINLDHRLIHESLLVASRPQPGQRVKNILTYQVNSSTEWGARRQSNIFVPNFYVDISSTIELKLEAFNCYKDELRDYPHPRSAKALRNRAAVYGSEVGCEYAEAFGLIFSLQN